ncbi:MAG: MFS transporter [Dehalococcoidales bacterium]|nr:MFS transporter [Dehalococcoidales bacterium]
MSQKEAKPPKKRLHYAWVIAIVGSIAMLIGVEPLALFGVFLGPIADDLGVGRGAVSAVYWVAYIFVGISSFAAGWATDRIGLRKTMILATLGTIIPLVALSRAHSLWQLYLWYGVVYGFARGGFNTPIMVTVTLWFKKKQGLAVGIVSSGLALGPMVLAPIFRYLIDAHGWANAFLIMGIASGIILAPCCWLLRDKPADLGLKPYGEGEPEKEPSKKKPAPQREAIYYRKGVPNFFKYAMTTQPFFMLPLIHLVGCVSHAVPLAHVVVMATDKGISPIAAATVLGVATGVSSLSRLLAPMFADKVGGRKAMMLFLTMQGIAILWLLPANSLWVFYLFSVFFGLGYGGEMTPFPIINRQYYGTAKIGSIYGFQTMFACLGMGMGGFIGGYLYDLMGNYNLAILVAVGMGLVGAVLAYMLVDPFKGKRPVTAEPALAR